MREILTILASLLIVALTAALVGPWFVDWTSQRGWVETELSRISGARVRVGGAIDLRLLPVPRLELANVELSGTRAEGPLLDVRTMKFELAVGSLIRGELRFTEALLDQPRLSLAREADGSVVLPRMPSFAPGDVQIERLSITDGSLALRPPDGGSPFVLGGLDFLGEAVTLAGPFKGAGQIKLGGAAAKYRFSTSVIEGDRIRLKALLDEGQLTPRGDLDGSLVFAASGRGIRLSFDGNAAFSGSTSFAGASAPWRLSGALKLDPAQAVLDPAELRAGEDDRAVAAGGSARLIFGGEPRGELVLAARQLDLDRLLGDGAGKIGSGARLAGVLGAALGDPNLGARAPWPLTVALTSPTAVLAGETLTDVKAEIGTSASSSVRIKGSALGPARSNYLVDGVLETGAAAAYRGRLEFGARDLPRFSDWLAASSPDLAGRLRGLPFRSVDIAGMLEASAGGVIGRDLVIQADRSALAGTIAFTRAMGAERARLFGDLTAEALDLDGLPELAGPARFAADMDLSLALEARAVRLARFGDGMVDAGRIGFKLLKDERSLKLERFSVADIGGASLSVTGGIEDGVARLEGRLDAARLGDLAELVRRIAPGPLADGLAARATALSPARLNLSARARTDASGLQLEELQIQGTARGTRIATQAQSASGLFDMTATFDSSDGPMLLRQMGLEALPLSGSGVGRLQVKAKGRPESGFEAEAEASLARSTLAFRGRVAGSIRSPEARGRIELRSPDVSPLLQVLAVALPDLGVGLPTQLNADLTVNDTRLALDKMTGSIAGTSFNGALSRPRGSTSGRIIGGFQIERLNLASLAGLALGPLGPPPRNGLWPDGKFAPGLADAPPMLLALEIGQFELAPGSGGAWMARNARLNLGLSPGIVTLDEASMSLGAGRLDGRLTIRRDGATASVAGRVGFSDQPPPAGPTAGTVSGQIDFTTTGQSFAALIGGLAGSGGVVMDDLVIANADLGAIARVVESADRGAFGIEEGELRRRLTAEFDRAPIRLGDRPFDAALAAGVLRLAPRTESNAPARFSASLDLRNMNLSAQLALTSPTQPKDWTGSPPSAVLAWQGRAGELRRTIEAAPLINAISARAIAREAARVDALEADIRERASFNRRLKAQEFVRRREREVADFLAQQRRAEELRLAEEARRKADEELRAAEEALRRAAEEVRRAKAQEETQRKAQEDALRKPVEPAPKAADPIGRLLGNGAPDDAAARAAEQAERERRRRASEVLRRRPDEPVAAPQRPASRVPLPPYPALEPLQPWPK